MRRGSQRLSVEPTDPVTATFRGLVRFHLHDWLVLFLLAILDGALNIIEPFHRYVGSFDIKDFMFPLKKNTIPFGAVPVIAIVIPLVFILLYFFFKRDLQDLHHAVLGLLFSVLITAVITDAIKDAVGRARPDFFWRCFPDGVPLYNNVTSEVQCTGSKSVIKEGHKSFPSGHTSWSFAGLTYLSLYLAGKLELFNRRAHVAKLAIVLSPLLCAALVGVSRVDDYWHHWQDVFGGALIGFVMAILCYHQQFPLLCNPDCMHAFPFKGIVDARWNGGTPQDWPPNTNGSPVHHERNIEISHV